MIGILHLSDLHIKSSEDDIMYMSEDICNSIINEYNLIKKLIIIISGDIAYKGDNDEYTSAYYFIDDLKSKLNIEVEIVMVPGNHDCEFKTNNLRDQVIDIIIKDKNNISDEFIDICCKPQENFFNFYKEFDDCKDKYVFSDNLLKIKEVNIDQDRLFFILINTSWISQINERPGHLYFPINRYLEEIKRCKNGIIISVFHHPSKWQHPDDSNEFDRTIEKVSDFIFSGHEHYLDSYEKNSSNVKVVYFRGQALQKFDGMFKSGFSFVLIDTNEKEYKYSEYDYINSKYKVINKSEWISYEEIIKNRNNNLDINDNFMIFLNDVGMNLNNPKKDILKLDDVFVYPELEKKEYKNNDNEFTYSIIKSEEYFEEDIKKPVIIYGDDKYGKTTLAKKLFIDYYNKGLVPIYIDASILKRGDLYKVQNLIYKTLHNQYIIDDAIEDGEIEKRIIIIVDNLEKINGTIKSRYKFMHHLNNYYTKVIYFCKSFISIEDIIYDENVEDKNIFIDELYIKKFRTLLKNKLIHKWNIIGEYNAQYTDEFICKDEEKLRQVDMLLGKNYIPSIPFYILIILQAFEMGNEHNFVDSSYGYYYEYLILKTLTKISKNNGEIDAINSFLINLAEYFYVNNIKEISKDDLFNFHTKFVSEYKIPLGIEMFHEPEIFVTILCNENLLINMNNNYEFKYKYVYYYYIGKYFSNNMNNENVREKVSEMIDKLYVEEYANIIIFIIYMNKHEFIFNKLLDISNNIFKKHPDCELKKDIKFINELQNDIPQIVIENISPVEYREKQYEKKDSIEERLNFQESLELEDEDSYNEVDELRELNLAFKCMEISGQILKNYWGSLRGDIKKNIGVSLYSLGLRSLTEVNNILENAKDGLSKVITENFKSKNISINENLDMIEKVSKRMVFIFAAYFTNGMVEKIVECVGDKNLIETYKDIEEELKYNSVKLINLSIKLRFEYHMFPFSDVENLLKENNNNVLVKFLIKHMVREHLYMYKVSMSDKHKITNLIGITMQEVNLAEMKNYNRSNK